MGEKTALGFGWSGKIPVNGFVKAHESEGSTFAFNRLRAENIYGTLRTLENIDCSFDRIKTVISGYSVSGMTMSDIRKVDSYAQACNFLNEIVRGGTFGIDDRTLLALHSIVGAGEVIFPGKLRKVQVHIQNSAYIPPSPETIHENLLSGLDFLSRADLAEPGRAVLTFLFLSRLQPFLDCNKRTAALAMNGILLASEYMPFNFFCKGTKEKEKFLLEMATFYESKDASTVMSLLNEIALEQNHISPAKKESPETSGFFDAASRENENGRLGR